MGKFIITKHKPKTNRYEQLVLSELHQNIHATDMDGFCRGFDYGLKMMKRESTGTPSTFYRMERINTNEAQLWHLNIHGEPDRKVSTITLEQTT